MGGVVLGVILAAGQAVEAQVDLGPPPLTPPIELPPEPARSTQSVEPPALVAPLEPMDLESQDNRPLLVVPGLPTPRARTSTGVRMLPNLEPIADEPPVPEISGPPPLVGPADLGGRVEVRGSGQPRFLPAFPEEPTPPPLDGDLGGRPRLRLESVPTGSRLLDAEKDALKRPDTAGRERPATSPQPERRRLFGFIPLLGPLGRPPENPPPPPAATTPTSEPRGGADRLDETDAEEALEKRLDRQIRNLLGNRIRSLDVRVTGRTVDVEARPSRFWYKRSVKKTLETLPALAGYRTRINVLD